jgi:hypothetical protein
LFLLRAFEPRKRSNCKAARELLELKEESKQVRLEESREREEKKGREGRIAAETAAA